MNPIRLTGLGVEGHLPRPSLVSLNKVLPAISQFNSSDLDIQ